MEEDVLEQSLARTALSQFYHQGIHRTKWTVFHDSDHLRVAYHGTRVSNISQLLAQEDGIRIPSSVSNTLLSPFPAIRPVRPWKSSADSLLAPLYRPSFIQELGSLPAKDISDSLVEAFFNKVHPGFPIVDEVEFRSRYNDPANPPPLLLLQTIYLAGYHVSSHPQVKSSYSSMKVAFFRRAKALFDMHHENDRLNLAQAALLFTWHLQGADDVSSNTYYWIGVTCRIAFGLGMHRDASQAADANSMPGVDRRIWRRVWWTLYQMDVLTSLHHGRPPNIDPEHCDQPPLQPGDFVERNLSMNEKVNVDFCIQNASLCSIIAEVVRISSPASTRRFCESPNSFQESRAWVDAKLIAWYFQLPIRHPQAGLNILDTPLASALSPDVTAFALDAESDRGRGAAFALKIEGYLPHVRGHAGRIPGNDGVPKLDLPMLAHLPDDAACRGASNQP